MRRKEREISDRNFIDAIIERAHVCRIGLSQNDVPYIVPMNFGYNGRYLYFHCAPEGKKLDIIRNNPRVCFEMDTDYELVKAGENPCGCSTKYRSVIGTGTAMILTDINEKSEALNIILDHYGASRYIFSEKELES